MLLFIYNSLDAVRVGPRNGAYLVKPREAVEWALYYPPLVHPRPESYPPALRAALSAYRANDLPAAFAALERVPARDRDGRYLLLRAAPYLIQVPRTFRLLTLSLGIGFPNDGA